MAWEVGLGWLALTKSRPLTISDQGATLRVTTLIRTGFDANASTVPILIPGMVTGAPVSVA